LVEEKPKIRLWEEKGKSGSPTPKVSETHGSEPEENTSEINRETLGEKEDPGEA